jgi:hypothetical protein
MQVPEKLTLVAHLQSRGFETVASGLVDGVLKVYFYGTGATLAAAGHGSQSVSPATAFLAEFIFGTADCSLRAKFKCTDEAATATFVRVRNALRARTRALVFTAFVLTPRPWLTALPSSKLVQGVVSTCGPRGSLSTRRS